MSMTNWLIFSCAMFKQSLEQVTSALSLNHENSLQNIDDDDDDDDNGDVVVMVVLVTMVVVVMVVLVMMVVM